MSAPPSYQPVRGLARWTCYGWAAVILADVAVIAALDGQLAMIEAALSGLPVSLVRAAAADLRAQWAALAHAGVSLAALLLFCSWLYRTYRNLPALGIERLRFTPGWAVAWFFVPLANLWYPVQVMQELWRATDHRAPGGPEAFWQEVPGNPLITVWWLMRVGTLLLGQVSLVLLNQAAAEPDGYLMALRWLGVSHMADLIVAMLTLWLVRRVTARQERRAVEG